MAERMAMLLQPLLHITVCFGGRSIFHGLQNVLDGSHFKFSLRSSVTIGARIASGHEVL